MSTINRAVEMAARLARIPQPSEKDHARLREYEQVKAILEQGGSP